MIITENIIINGIEYKRTYSDAGFMVERDGVQYGAAIDPVNSNRSYTETNISVEEDATEADYLEALERLGVSE